MSANYTPNQNEYKNLTPFKCWLLLQINNWGQNNFPFVESDFDELTNYGMLMKLMKALKDVISNQNEVEQDMTNLFNAFTELQTYVNDYFDNLDVQDEINNKLDDMVESGELQEIIATYLNSKAIFGFDNVESMKSAENLIDGSYARTLGFYAMNDGGSATYKIREIRNDDVVDGMTIIAMSNNNLIAEYIKTPKINPKSLGAYGDGTHDDYAPIQKALNIGNVLLPNGRYFITHTIEFSSNKMFDGNNQVIIPNNNITAFSLVGNGVNNAIVNTKMQNVIIQTTEHIGSCGVYLKDGYFNYFDNINIARLNGDNTYGFKIVNGFNHTITNSRVLGSTSNNGQIGLDISSTNNNDGIENMTNCKYDTLLLQNTQYGVKANYATTANVVEFNNLGFSSCNYAFHLSGYALPLYIRNPRMEAGNGPWETYGIYQTGNIHSHISGLNTYNLKYPVYNDSTIDLLLDGQLCFTGTAQNPKYNAITSNGNVILNTIPYLIGNAYNLTNITSLASGKYIANGTGFVNFDTEITSDSFNMPPLGNNIVKASHRVFNIYGARGSECLVYATESGYHFQSSSNGSPTCAFTGDNVPIEPYKFYRVKMIDANKWTLVQ